jgi:hypothetical protein
MCESECGAAARMQHCAPGRRVPERVQASRSCGFGGPVEGSSRDGAGGLGSGVSARLPKAKNRLIGPLMMPMIVPWELIARLSSLQNAPPRSPGAMQRSRQISVMMAPMGGDAPRRRIHPPWAGAQGADPGWAGVLGATGGEGRGPRRMEGADVAGEHLHDQRARCAGAEHVWTPRV